MTFYLKLGFVREAGDGVGGAMRRVGKEKTHPRRRRGVQQQYFL